MQIEIERGGPVGGHWSLQLEEVDIDFGVSGLPHAVVKQAENSPVRELEKEIESHPHRQDLQADLQQCNAYNPFSETSKKMIHDMGNVELFELCEAIPKVQCSGCLLYKNQGIVYCTCGHLLRESESSRHLHQWRLDTLSQSQTTSLKRDDFVVLGTVITEAQKEHFIAHNARRRCIKKKLRRNSLSLPTRLNIQPKYPQMDIGSSLNPELCH